MAVGILRAGIALTFVVVSSAAQSQGVDGLYQPMGAAWSCSAEQIGMDGGALAIQNGVLNGVENRCKLTDPVDVGDGTRYTAVCAGEGNTYHERITVTPTRNGVKIERNDYTIYWQHCGADQAAPRLRQQAGAHWGFSNRSAYITNGSDHFALSCDIFNPSSMYPTAAMTVPCPLCFPHETTSYTLQVDDTFAQAFDFERVSNAGGSTSDLDYHPNWHEGLVPALMSGNILSIVEAGNVIVTFPLTGSSRAIGALRTSCN